MKIKIFLAALVTLCFACNKQPDFNYPEGTVGISKITYFPVLTLKGSNVITLPVGTNYVEPGVTAKEGTTDIPYTVSGSVDKNTPGVYRLTYTAVNKDGFSASITRTVAVYSTDASAASNDFSGTYLRAATGATSTWTKIAPGVYSVFNPGGAVGTNVTVIVFNTTGNQIHMPAQTIGDGSTMTSAQEVYSTGPPATYKWQILNPGYGTSIRTFVKQ